jgi:hypothetical protein
MKLPLERTSEWKSLRLLGKISLGSSLIGLAMLVTLFFTFLMTDKLLSRAPTHVSKVESALIGSCVVLFVVAQLLAIVTGLVAWRTSMGKTGIILSGTIASLVGVVFLLLLRYGLNYG